MLFGHFAAAYLTPLDYYLWAAVKDKCNADKPETIDALKNNIREAFDEIQLHAIDNALKNWTDSLDYYMTIQGSHLNEISNKKVIWENIQFSKKKYLAEPLQYRK